ncbi:MAG: GFA family protein [bacterium]
MTQCPRSLRDMSDYAIPYDGHCLCGAVRFACDAAPLWQGHCHCESCRRATSSGFTSYLGVADGHWRWTGADPATHSSSPGVTRYFCAICGSQMAYRADRFPGEMHFFAASLSDPTAYRPTTHFFAAEVLPWVHLADGLRRK